MSGLLALLDDVAAIAKVAATSVDDVAMAAATTADDVAMAAAEAGSKTAGVVIDDAAVTPKYVHGFKPARELPIIWQIAKGSLVNKLVILLPVAMGLSKLLPSAITPLLMLGGSYLCFEGAEKIFHAVLPHADEHVEADMKVKNPGQLEAQKVKGAIKTDFILSAEIMTIALSSIPESTFIVEAGALALVPSGVTSTSDVAYVAPRSELRHSLSTVLPEKLFPPSCCNTTAQPWRSVRSSGLNEPSGASSFHAPAWSNGSGNSYTVLT